MKYYLIAGERSGDLHGSNLIRNIYKLDPDAEIRFLGGELMQAEGGTLYKHYSEISYMLIFDVIKNLGTILKNLKYCVEDIKNFKPDVLLLIDFSGFNLRVANKIKPFGIPIHYYISPKVWAWNQSRAYKIKRLIDKMYVIMPFEKDFYKKYGYEVEYVGNPILDAIVQFKPDEDFLQKYGLGPKKIIAVLPGSRRQEVSNMLDTMMGLATKYPQYTFVIAAVGSLPHSYYHAYQKAGFMVVKDDTYNLLTHAHAALVTSGTATLETALFKVPQIVCYKTNLLTYHIAKAVLKIKYISLVNLVADNEIVIELIQKDFNIKRLEEEFNKICTGPTRGAILSSYDRLWNLMGRPGTSLRVAQSLYDTIKGSSSAKNIKS